MGNKGYNQKKKNILGLKCFRYLSWTKPKQTHCQQKTYLRDEKPEVILSDKGNSFHVDNNSSDSLIRIATIDTKVQRKTSECIDSRFNNAKHVAKRRIANAKSIMKEIIDQNKTDH